MYLTVKQQLKHLLKEDYLNLKELIHTTFVIGFVRVKGNELRIPYSQTFKQEESYTSKASFFDNDDMVEYNADNPIGAVFSGTRVRRGLYKTAKGYCLNADVNGALNILKKSSVVRLNVLYSSGEVDTPVRIRIA